MNADVCRLSDLANIQGGYAFKSADFGDNGVAVVKIANIQPPVIVLNGVDRVAPEKLAGLERFRLSDGDILMAMTGATVGKVARFKETEPAYLNQRVARISSKKGKAFDDFIYAVVSLPGFDSLIEGASAGSAQANVSAAGIGSVQISRLAEGEQLAIGEIARVFDDRITLLRETNATLEAIAQALFKSWFVDFDPVRAKMEGRAPEGMDEATAALFPDGFEESELGLVPRGWRLLTLEDAYEINPTRKLKKGVGAPYLDMAGVSTSGHSVSGVTEREMGSGTKFINGDTLLARITPCLENGKTAFVDFLTDEQTGWGSTEFVVLHPKAPLPPYHGYLLARHSTFREFAIQSMSGTSGRQRVQNDVLGRFPVVVPSNAVANIFSEVVGSIQQKISANHQQAQTLASLRDTLLPRLISGQLRLPEAEALIA
ncbi:restriction endonuclease subunit S [Chromobacterium sp. ASV23]|uniref:restriction endonuclease subunit S n=1 Tax=Chromobacterium sp. ASV23 TaxID=2795110 RepID=UPI0018ED3A3C|nr:restriction endonuclease subunit S [Chromobacterium sp. ASV23]